MYEVDGITMPNAKVDAPTTPFSKLEEIEDAVNHGESTSAGSEGEHSNSETEAEIAKKSSESVEDFFDAVDGGTSIVEENDATGGDTQRVVQKKSGRGSKAKRVDPSPAESDYNLIHLQAQLDQAMKENARLQELLKQHQQTPPTLPSPKADR
ncbi:hypothetical protein Dimus_015809 [Dionaea muscipula]